MKVTLNTKDSRFFPSKPSNSKKKKLSRSLLVFLKLQQEATEKEKTRTKQQTQPSTMNILSLFRPILATTAGFFVYLSLIILSNTFLSSLLPEYTPKTAAYHFLGKVEEVENSAFLSHLFPIEETKIPSIHFPLQYLTSLMSTLGASILAHRVKERSGRYLCLVLISLWSFVLFRENEIGWHRWGLFFTEILGGLSGEKIASTMLTC